MAKLTESKKLAETLVEAVTPYTTRVMIAGSIRRGKSEVKDIEICAIPKITHHVPEALMIPAFTKKREKQSSNDFWHGLPSNWALFDYCTPEKSDIPKNNGKQENLLYLWANRQELVRWIKPGVSELITWEVKPDGKYWRGVLNLGGEPIKLDLFILNNKNWGVLSTIRTGPAKFSEALVSVIKKRTPYRVKEGHLVFEETGEIIPCAEEKDFFKNAGIRFVPVERRSIEDPYQILTVEKEG